MKQLLVMISLRVLKSFLDDSVCFTTLVVRSEMKSRDVARSAYLPTYVTNKLA